MTATHWTPLISAETLHQHLHDPQLATDLVIVDCRFELGQPDAGRAAWQRAHLPGAQYAHLDHDLSGPITATSGRHPLPGAEQLTERFSRWGIDHTKQVIAYDADNGAMAAARLWWLLRWLGHEQVAVLDGGLKQWLASGYAVTQETETPDPTPFTAHQQDDLLVTADGVATHAQQPGWRLVDARAPERYAGEIEPLDPVAGHIPGALNHPFVRNLDTQGCFLPAATLHQQWRATLGTASPAHSIFMCGSGVTACHNLLAMEIAGLPGGKLYAGSWSEWCRDPHRPVARGRNATT